MAKNAEGQETNDQRINTNGRARLLSVGKFLPKEWEMVRVTRTRTAPGTVWLRVDQITLRVGA